MQTANTRRAIAAMILTLFAGTVANADSVVLNANHDNNIASELPGNSSGGADAITVGRNNQGNLRRGMLSFDLVGALPGGATVTSVTLTMNLIQGQGNRVISLRPALTSWGEGIATGTGGQGSAAGAGDATWSSSHFGSTLWSTAGGDFGPVSASTNVNAAVPGLYQWSSAAMLADVNGWLANPTSNFGWFMVGVENVNQTAMRFESRESTAGNVPRLTIEYTVPTPGAMGLLGLGALAVGRRRR